VRDACRSSAQRSIDRHRRQKYSEARGDLRAVTSGSKNQSGEAVSRLIAWRRTVTQQTYSTEGFRPIAYVALDDLAVRSQVVAILDSAGWTTIVEPTGFHLLRSIADVIDGSRSWLRPRLIVMDAFARGCAGTTIALGLRDLGITIPIVLARAPGQPNVISTTDRMLHVVDRDAVERTVSALARTGSPSLASTSSTAGPPPPAIPCSSKELAQVAHLLSDSAR
jgi:hypothetical protein